MKDSGNLCFQPNDCQKRLLTICNTPIKSETYGTINGSATDEGQERFIELLSALAPAAFNLIGDLFGGNSKFSVAFTLTNNFVFVFCFT